MTHQDVQERFASPPGEYGPIPFWWWHGETLTEERLVCQLDQLKAKCVAGVNINYQHDSSGMTYPGEPALFSEAWWDLWERIVAACKERGMTIGFDDYTLAWPDKGIIARTLTEKHPELRGARLEEASAIRSGLDATHPDIGAYTIEYYYEPFKRRTPDAVVHDAEFLLPGRTADVRRWWEWAPPDFHFRQPAGEMGLYICIKSRFCEIALPNSPSYPSWIILDHPIMTWG